MLTRRIALACLLTLVAGSAVALGGCASMREPMEQRTSQGPTAEEFWTLKVVLLNGREPNFEERRHWEDEIDNRIGVYLREHPEAANSLDVSTFRFFRRVAVGQSKEQVLILLGPPDAATTDPAEMEKLARKYWPQIKPRATEAWVYELGWRMFFNGNQLVDITQYLPR